MNIGLLLGLFVVSEAIVQFEKSVLYDEKDFEDQPLVRAPLYCTEACKFHGCHIYVSVPLGSEEVAKWINIDIDDRILPIYDVANITDMDGLKTPLIVPKGNAELQFLNNNFNFTTDGDVHFNSAPLAVWIVFGNAYQFDVIDVYDGVETNRLTSPTGGIITILGVEPYELSVTSDGPVSSFTAITAGFDALESPDQCVQVIREENFAAYEDLQYAPIRSPLLTLAFRADNSTTIEVHTEQISHEILALGNNMFLTSPGYIGCSVKDGIRTTKIFRSSLYEAETRAHFTSSDPVSVMLSSDVYLDEDCAVDIVVDGQAPIKWSGKNVATTLNLTAKELIITWNRDDEELDQYFMIRVEPDDSISTTSSPSSPSSTSSTSSKSSSTSSASTTTSSASSLRQKYGSIFVSIILASAIMT